MRLALAIALVFCLTSLVHAEQFSSLEEQMSQSEFNAAGLNKLSPDVLKSLDAWLAAHYAATTKYVTASGAPVVKTPIWIGRGRFSSARACARNISA